MKDDEHFAEAIRRIDAANAEDPRTDVAGGCVEQTPVRALDPSRPIDGRGVHTRGMNAAAQINSMNRPGRRLQTRIVGLFRR